MRCCLPLVVLALSMSSPAFAQRGGATRDRQQPNVLQRGTASIAGRVVAGNSGRPLRLARVTATAPGLTDGRVAITDENGSFEFPALPAGHYTLSASKTGYLTANFGQRRPLRAGRAIEVRDGQRIRDIDFRLPSASVIAGRVIDQDGEPLVRASVRALRFRFAQGDRRIEPAGNAETDDRGVFRIYGVPPGTYLVAASAQTADIAGRRVIERSSDGSAVTISFEPDPSAAAGVTYVPTYYPGVAALSDAVPIAVPISEEVAGIDFTLQLATAARVTGVVLGANGAPTASAMVRLIPDDSRGVSGQTYTAAAGRGGTFSILNVPPGRYVVFALGTGRDQRGTYAVQPLSVSGSLVSDVSLVLAPGMTVSGQLTFDGATIPSAQEMSRMRIGLWTPFSASLPAFDGGRMNATPRQDGSFSIPDLPPGSRMVRVSGLPQPWALKAVYLDGRDVTDEMVDLKPGETTGRVIIEITDKVTTLSGTVADEDGQPMTDYTVIAFAADSNLWRPMSRFIQAGRPDKAGVYTIRGLPPGEYLLRAVDDVDQGEWYDPELLQQLRTGATRVILQNGDTKSPDLKIVVSRQ